MEVWDSPSPSVVSALVWGFLPLPCSYLQTLPTILDTSAASSGGQHRSRLAASTSIAISVPSRPVERSELAYLNSVLLRSWSILSGSEKRSPVKAPPLGRTLSMKSYTLSFACAISQSSGDTLHS